MAFPGAARIQVNPGPVVKVVIQRAKPVYSRAHIENISAGQIEVAVSFPTPLPDTNWVLASCMIVNSADNKNLSANLTVKGITAPSQGGFTVMLSGPAPTANYKLHWAIAEKYNP